MQGKVLKFETFVAICIDFIKDFTYLLHFYFLVKDNVVRTVWRKKIDFQYFWLIKHIKLRSFNVK